MHYLAAAVLPACLISSPSSIFLHPMIQNENVESVVQTLLASSTVLNAIIDENISAQYPQTHTYSVRRGLALQHFSL